MVRLFGTDGVRGVANVDLTAELALDLAAAAVEVLTEGRAPDAGRPLVVVGRDTRPSGQFLEAAVIAGLASCGADAIRVGVVPTPTVAHIVAATRADLGVMLSASHNPMPDNGIKLFAAGGHKLPDEIEDEIEARLGAPRRRRPTGGDVGRVLDDPAYIAGLIDGYVAHLLSTLPVRLDGLKVVVDCAQGAACVLAPRVLREAGAEVVPLNADGDGQRINDRSGATHLDSLRAAVLEHGADVGIAHDGDADRCLAVDATGEVIDGDQIMAVIALAMAERGELADGRVVVTVMSNLGFHQAMRQAGIEVLATPVGDRYVLAEMRRTGAALGGEQSGHIVFLRHATTGDGLLTALTLLGRVRETRQPLGELAEKAMTRLPQVLVNVRGVDRSGVTTSARLQAAVADAEAELGEDGRVLLRPSGTEPLVRVMVEAPTDAQARAVATRLASVVEAELRR
ncbi:MAG: phosphoglucosamine mutase [Frankia sp.]|nr:phosphoglucosamine mutase [Frankia sp.]